jgi:hypothetical protein
MKTGFSITAALLMYFFPELWPETLVALALGLVLFWWVPEPWTASPSTGSVHHGQAVTELDSHDWKGDSGVVINPATGLPMVDALYDVAGNPYGSALPDGSRGSLVAGYPSLNPASGLPMVDTMFDVAGNPFGVSSDSHFE